MKTGVEGAKEKLRSILVYGGFPLSSRHVIDGVAGDKAAEPVRATGKVG